MFTNNSVIYNNVVKFRDDAINDGWTCEPTYKNFEPWEQACTLTKDGFQILILTRDHYKPHSPNIYYTQNYHYEASIHAYGPDQLTVKVTHPYNMQQIINNLLLCDNCNEYVDFTTRYDFAGRCCKICLPEMQKKYEYPGWCN